MTASERAFEDLVHRLAERFVDLDVVALLEASALRRAFEEALPAMDAEGFFRRIVAQGRLRGDNPYGILIYRVRRIAAAAETEARLAVDAAEQRRLRLLRAATERGLLYADLVAQGELERADAERQLAQAFSDPEITAVALAALGDRS